MFFAARLAAVMDMLRAMLAPYLTSKATRLRACMWVALVAAVLESLGVLFLLAFAPTWAVLIPAALALALAGMAMHCRIAAAVAQAGDPDHG